MVPNSSWWFSSPLFVGFGIFVALLAIWSLYWKGRALWKAARLGHLGWFIALLIINTAGILEILYIYIFSKPKGERGSHHDHEHHHHEHEHAHDHTHGHADPATENRTL